jgi:hypothetical protein
MPGLVKVVDDEHKQECAWELAEQEVREKENRQKARANKVEDSLQRGQAGTITETELEAKLLALNIEYGVEDVLGFTSDDDSEVAKGESVAAMVVDDERVASPAASVR